MEGRLSSSAKSQLRTRQLGTPCSRASSRAPDSKTECDAFALYATRRPSLVPTPSHPSIPADTPSLASHVRPARVAARGRALAGRRGPPASSVNRRRPPPRDIGRPQALPWGLLGAVDGSPACMRDKVCDWARSGWLPFCESVVGQRTRQPLVLCQLHRPQFALGGSLAASKSRKVDPRHEERKH